MLPSAILAEVSKTCSPVFMAETGQNVGEPGQSSDVKVEKDPILADINKRILDAFDIFDHDGNKTVDVREVGTIIRSLGCYPSEAELEDVLTEVEEEEPTGFIRLEKFQPTMARILLEKKYSPASEEQLVKAFEVLDENHTSHLSLDTLRKYMTEGGEPFSQEEVEEMLKAAEDPDRGVVLYRDFVTLMLPEQEHHS